MHLIDDGLLPDPVLRLGIRALLAQRRLSLWRRGGPAARRRALRDHVARLRSGPIAASVDAANSQHYEVPARFFELVLGAHLKYSAAYWPPGVRSLAEAEEASLSLVAERARIGPDHRVLDLGCGWGSLSLYLARRFPGLRIQAVSNSAHQRAFIEARAREHRAGNLEVITADVNTFEPEGRFDRVVSIEMFEHLTNWERMLGRIATWLQPEGRLFIHVFAHTSHPYRFEDRGGSDWMARHFFTGGQMPSADLLAEFQRDLIIEARWTLSGAHYARTAEAWLSNLDRRRAEALHALGGSESPAEARRRFHRWRVFFMACAELFGYRRGQVWGVGHYLLRPREEME